MGILTQMGNVPVLTAEQVLALASDAASAKAGRSQASPSRWQGAGRAGSLMWGYCQGSGKTPYQAVVDFAGPAFKCSCPSRKFPCKHTIGLMLLAADNHVPEQAEPADFAEGWSRTRQQRIEKAATPKAPPNPENQAKRAAQRGNRAKDGLQELDLWLQDQVRTGLAGADRSGYREFDRVAARMVDAQVPGVAGTLRNIASIPSSGSGWPGRLLGELGLLRLLAQAHTRLDSLEPSLADTVKAHVGYPITKEDVLASAAVQDSWHVLAVRDTTDAKLTTRRAWLQGAETGAKALVLSFAFSGQPLDSSLLPQTSLAANLHFYPGSQPLRALVGARHAEPKPAAEPPEAQTFNELVDGFAQTLANDPWLETWPAVVVGTPVSHEGNWLLIDDHQRAISLRPANGNRLLAVSGGRELPIMGTWSRIGLTPLTAWTENGPVTL